MDALMSVLEWFDKTTIEDPIDGNILTNFLRIWGFLGIWPVDYSKRKLSYFIPRCFIFASSLLIGWYCFHPIGKENDFVVFLDQMYIMTLVGTASVKTLAYLQQPKSLKKLCDDLQVLHEGHIAEGCPHIKTILRRTKLLSKFFYLYLPLSCQVLLVGYVGFMAAMSIVTSKPVYSWTYPCDISSSPCMTTVMAIELFFPSASLQMIGFTDMLLVEILSQTCSQFKILNYNLENIREYAETKVSVEREALNRYGYFSMVDILPEYNREAGLKVELSESRQSGIIAQMKHLEETIKRRSHRVIEVMPCDQVTHIIRDGTIDVNVVSSRGSKRVFETRPRPHNQVLTRTQETLKGLRMNTVLESAPWPNKQFIKTSQEKIRRVQITNTNAFSKTFETRQQTHALIRTPNTVRGITMPPTRFPNTIFETGPRLNYQIVTRTINGVQMGPIRECRRVVETVPRPHNHILTRTPETIRGVRLTPKTGSSRRVESVKGSHGEVSTRIDLSKWQSGYRSRRRESDRNISDVQRNTVTTQSMNERERLLKCLEVNNVMEQRLVKCVKHHQTLIRLTRDFERVYNPHLISQISYSCFGTVLMALYAFVVPQWGVKEAAILTLAVLVTMELFVFSWFANQITQESVNVLNAVYACDWFEGSETFKRHMRVIISRSNNPLVIRVAGFVPLSLETFRIVMKSAYSYLMAMLTVARNTTHT